MDATEPPEVAELCQLLSSLPGVVDVGVKPVGLVDFDVDNLRFAEMADLPSAALRRTKGGLPGEFLIQVWLKVAPIPESWLTLEFLAWHVRDSARGGDVAQMRVRGLPPSTAMGVQLGTTLMFVIEWFVLDPVEDPEAPVVRLRSEISSLRTSVNVYGHLLGRARGDQPS